MPSSIVTGNGKLAINQQFTFALTGYHEPRLDRARQRFLNQILRRTGIPLHPDSKDPAKATLLVNVGHAGSPVQSLEDDESYKLEITSEHAVINAPSPLGALHGRAAASPARRPKARWAFARAYARSPRKDMRARADRELDPARACRRNRPDEG